MVKKPKIVIIGCGSTSFGLACLKDAFNTKELWGSKLVLVDINENALKRMAKAAERVNNELGAGYCISHTTDRCAALPDADYIIISIAVKRNELWKHDFHVPKKYGINHVLGENGGPGAVFHTMRNIPIIMEICRDIERICPDALLINFTNPESRICLAVNKYTKVRAIGLCHQIGEGIHIISKIMGIDADKIDVKAYGLNHFTWFSDIREKGTGKDLYPVLREKEKTFDSDFEKLSRFMFHSFGLFPTSGDGHLGEYLPYAHEMTGTEGYNFEGDENNRITQKKYIEELGSGAVELDSRILGRSGERAFDIIRGITYDTNEVIDAVNIPNNGCIANLPGGSVVEVPAVVSGKGVNGLCMGRLPSGIAALCNNQIDVQNLVVDAGVIGDRKLVLQALLTDPNVPSASAAENIFGELMKIHAPYLMQFK